MDQHDLERRVRRLERLLLGVAVVGALPWLALGALPILPTERLDLPFVLTARSFEVRSPEDVVLASVGSRAGHGYVDVRSAGGARLVDLGGAQGPGGAIRVRSEAGKEVVYLGSDASGAGNLTMRTAAGDGFFSANNSDGHGGSVLVSTDDQPIAFIGMTIEDQSVVQTWNNEGQQTALFGNDSAGGGIVRVFTDGKRTLSTGTTADGQSFLELFGPQEKMLAVLVADDAGGFLSLRDPDRLRARLGLMANGHMSLNILNAEGDLSAVIGETNNGLGGVVQAYADGEHLIFSAGADLRQACGVDSALIPRESGDRHRTWIWFPRQDSNLAGSGSL